MSCLDVNVLDRYAVGGLTESEAHDAERHLDGCVGCRRALAALAGAAVPGLATDGALDPRAVVTLPGLAADAEPTPSAEATLMRTSAPRSGPAVTVEVTAERVGRHVVLSRLGAGGMGVVYAAYDPDLDRKVALKLVRGSDGEARARFLREAQAMARLDHPNVITVYDVGVADDQAYIAMELVEGGTLRAWMAQRRPWREVVARFLAAGRGLAAAHAAGIIHRDFKPDNVLIGTDGDVRVTDFGLARAASDGPASSPRVDLAGSSGSLASGSGLASGVGLASSSGLLDAELTRTGAVLGTPAYMAPEQYAGTLVDERSDQFAFCVALFEALYGQRPFVGETPRQLVVAIGSGQIRAVDAAVPAWLRRVVVRGLTAEPALRWPSMAALLEALAMDPARRRRRIAMATATAAVALLGLGAAWRVGAGARVEPCRADPAAFAGVWDPARRASVRAAFVATGGSFAVDAFDRVADELDRRASAWTIAVHVACIDTRVRRIVPESMLERRMACLADRRDEVRALTAQLGQVDAVAAAAAPAAAARLPSVDACAQLTRLLDVVPPPADARILDVRRQLADATAAQALGQTAKANAMASAALPLASQVGWAPARAELLLLVGQTARLANRRDQARTALVEAVHTADAGRDDAARARAWMELARISVTDPDVTASAQALEHAAGAAARSGEAALGAVLDRVRGNVASDRGDLTAALPLYERARDWLRAHLGAEHPDTLDAEIDVAVLLGNTGRPEAAIARLTELLEPLRRAFGARHPRVASALLARGVAQGRLLHREAAEADFAAALAIQRAAFGDGTAPVADLLSDLGSARLDNGDAVGALGAMRQALAIRTRIYGADSIEAARLLGRIGAALRVEGDPAGAEANLRQARETLVRRFGELHPDLPYLAAEEISALLDLHRYRECLERAHWYVAITERINGADSYHAAIARAGAADMILNAGGDPAEAVRLLEASWHHLMTAAPLYVAPQKYNLARALWRSGGDRVRALALMNEALAFYVSQGDDFATEQGEIRAWLAHPN